MRSKTKYKKPEEYKKQGARTVVSGRVSAECKEALEWASRNADMGVSELVAGVLEDYSKWLMAEYMKRSRTASKKFE